MLKGLKKLLMIQEEESGQVAYFLFFFLLAGRYTLLEQKALDSFLPLCESRGIGIVTGGPYNSGILASGKTSPVEQSSAS